MNDDDEPKPKPRPNGSRALIIGAAVVLVLACVCGIGGYLARVGFVRYAARSALAAHGIACGDGFDLETESGHATVAPCTCTVEEGPVESFQLVEPVSLVLDGDTPTHVTAPHVIVTMRSEGPPVDAGALGPVASMMGVPQRIGGLVGAAAHVASMHPPAIDVGQLEVSQGGHTTVEVDTLALDGADPTGITAHEITLPSLSGPLGATATVTIDGLHGTASASEVRLTGQLALTGTAPLVGSVTRSGEVHVSGTGLDGDAAIYRVDL